MNKLLLTRRQLLKLSCGALLSYGFWPASKSYANTESFSFAVLNDLHCMSPECGTWLQRVADSLRKRNPRFCVLAGDLTDDASLEHMDTVRTIFGALPFPVKAIIGNHDIASGNDQSTFNSVFPGSLNYTFDEGGMQFLALDTTQGQGWQNTYIQKTTLDWLDNTLPKLPKERPLVVMTHFPLGFKVQTRPLNSDVVLQRLKDFNLQTVFSGHFHGQTSELFGTNFPNSSELITNKCCSLLKPNHDGTVEKGYYLCTVKDGRVTREFIQI